MPVKVENGDFCPVCKEKNMPPWKSPTETARTCQGCNTVEERKIRERGYYWILNGGNLLMIATWNGHRWAALGIGGECWMDLPEHLVEVKGKVIQGEWKE
jgi:hypothetical protein